LNKPKQNKTKQTGIRFSGNWFQSRTEASNHLLTPDVDHWIYWLENRKHFEVSVSQGMVASATKNASEKSCKSSGNPKIHGNPGNPETPGNGL
jgi:hypothetical protein